MPFIVVLLKNIDMPMHLVQNIFLNRAIKWSVNQVEISKVHYSNIYVCHKATLLKKEVAFNKTQPLFASHSKILF